MGPSWYERDVTIPEAWRGKRVTLFLERTKSSQVWLDGRPCGENPILCTPQEYVLGSIDPGSHRLTIAIDNSRRPVNAEMHQMSENTQGNWNGIIGRIELQATDPVWIDDVQVYPVLESKSVHVRVRIGNATGEPGRGVVMVLPGIADPQPIAPEYPQASLSWDTEGKSVEIPVPLPDWAWLWDEFHPKLTGLTVKLDSPRGRDERSVRFGLREFRTRDSQFTINGRTTFLRGKHDGCVFPLTGHPPMDVAGWRKYLGVCREYGLNHLRFHTWTPPDAAFTAADELGMYLQPELPFWGEYKEEVVRALRPEAERILKMYGNHPSFVMLSLGNECGGSQDLMGAFVRDLRALDARHLYAQGSNNFLGTRPLPPGDDYWTTVRVSTPAHPAIQNVRGSFATVDGGNGHVQIGPPATTKDYSAAIAGIPVPVVGHEVGQYTVSPNFGEIPRYTGVFRARNFELFRDKLAAAGMLDQAEAFFRASGKLAALCYREDIEAALRTPGFGGFQLLDLQDFPGQGTALVGMLDAFMDAKGAITPEAWRQFCGPVVPLARFERYTWTTAETFTAEIQVAHYGEKNLEKAAVHWDLSDSQGHRIANGTTETDLKQGGVRAAGHCTIPLSSIAAPARLTLTLRVPAAQATNAYPLWVFPAHVGTNSPPGVTLARAFDDSARKILADGGRVVLIPEAGRLANTVGGGFATDFWCWPMFHNTPGTMGVLCDPAHPALAGFPTAEHSDWQWFHLVLNSQPVILEETSKDFRPTVQVIDNLERNHKLGLVFEAKVGPGRLLVCAADLMRLQDHPEARQLLRSLLDYAASPRFAPAHELSVDLLRKLLMGTLPIKSATASTTQGEDHAAAKAIDGDPQTRWCASDDSAPQWLTVDLGSVRKIAGCAIRWENDRRGYRYFVEGSDDGTHWAVLSDQTRNNFGAYHRVEFPATDARYVRIRIVALPRGWASIREIDVFGAE